MSYLFFRFHDLKGYGIREGGAVGLLNNFPYDPIQTTLDEHDDDLKLVPTLVKSLVIPKIEMVVGHVWNPYSTKQTMRVSNALKGSLLF